MVEQVERVTKLPDFGAYMNKLFTIDAVFLNEDRHTHNIAILMNQDGKFAYCPIFDSRITGRYDVGLSDGTGCVYADAGSLCKNDQPGF